jgi:hypothetical protein
MACVQVCKPGALIHEQHGTITEKQFAAIIYADDPARFSDLCSIDVRGIHCVPPENALIGSSAAAQIISDLVIERQPIHTPIYTASAEVHARIGVLVCQCGNLISQVVDTQAVCDRASTWPNVVHAQTLPFSCSSEAAEVIDDIVKTHAFDKVVLAGCSCCSIDQVCYSCTVQRIRCKGNLGVISPFTLCLGPC